MASRDSVSPIESVKFSALPVEGFARGSCVTLYVHGQNAITKRDLRNKIAQLRSGFKPLMNVRTLFGTSGSAWGIIEIDTDGSVYINHIYGVDSITWQWVTVSVTFVC